MKCKRLWVLVVAGLLAVGLTGCGPSSSGAPVKIVATENAWDSQYVHNAIAKIVVEHAFDGYVFETSSASSDMNWLSLVAGDIDLDIESWTDNVASYPEDKAKGDIVDVGVLVPDSRQGLYVPRYVIEGDPERGIEPMAPDLHTVKDLLKYPDVFPDDEDPSRGCMYGGTPGYMADEVLHKKYEAYGLNEKFAYKRLGSEATSFASLAAAYNVGEAWVGYCYEPSWIAGKLDLVLLEDEPYNADLFFEGKCAYPSQDLKIVSSKYFAEKAPELVPFFQNYVTGNGPISEAVAYLDETKASYEETAIWFMRQNDELIDQWLPEKNAKMLRDYLATQP